MRVKHNHVYVKCRPQAVSNSLFKHCRLCGCMSGPCAAPVAAETLRGAARRPADAQQLVVADARRCLSLVFYCDWF